MELINGTRMITGFTTALEPSGRELFVLAIKGTFRIPSEPGARLRLHEEQEPLTLSDVYFGDPGLSAPKYEVDFAPRKHRCDVLLNGQAYAPDGRPTEHVIAGLRVGPWSKSFAVVGDRMWFTAGLGQATRPLTFTAMPISYDRAFGGVDQQHPDPAQHAAFTLNPSGRGFHKHLAPEWLDGTALPNTEQMDDPVRVPNGAYRPMSFGAIGRHWEPRIRFAGTYDEQWLEDVFPFLPADFDELYYQSAPADQQIDIPTGEVPAAFQNLTPFGHCDFIIPYFEAPVCVFPRSGGREDHVGQMDTIVIEPDLERVMITWRVTRPLRRNMFEIAQVLVGRKGREWWAQRDRLTFPVPIVVESDPDPDEEPEEEVGPEEEIERDEIEGDEIARVDRVEDEP